MDLASTIEVHDKFSEYYADDCAQARDTVVNSTSIQTGLKFEIRFMILAMLHRHVYPACIQSRELLRVI